MAVYDKKDAVNTWKQKNAGYYTWIMVIRVSYFWSGYFEQSVYTYMYVSAHGELAYGKLAHMANQLWRIGIWQNDIISTL